MSDQQAVDDESDAPLIDIFEMAVVFTIPVLVGAGIALTDPTLDVASGAIGASGVGWLLVRVRRQFDAVRTSDGIVRRRRPARSEALERLAKWEYDPKYDRLLALVLAVVGIGVFAVIPFGEWSDENMLGLVIVSHLGLVGALVVYGAAQR
ncbi:hypothetical protein KU306_16270 (plasmid) [Haloferax larsenii]|uniref:TIGR04206 family protein n=1 Tax=Haloferax larsenii TaxID=302484 RepID=A0ABY5RII5_HALLR|nr:hypothetical protein [Haloferax larsenii]UVE52167.1 hypothetical protein KU306_16270 [Haloferax larsenii]